MQDSNVNRRGEHCEPKCKTVVLTVGAKLASPMQDSKVHRRGEPSGALVGQLSIALMENS